MSPACNFTVATSATAITKLNVFKVFIIFDGRYKPYTLVNLWFATRQVNKKMKINHAANPTVHLAGSQEFVCN